MHFLSVFLQNAVHFFDSWLNSLFNGVCNKNTIFFTVNFVNIKVQYDRISICTKWWHDKILTNLCQQKKTWLHVFHIRNKLNKK